MQDDLDKLIDASLCAYSNAEPLAGLEERVLNRVRAARMARRRRWRWALGAPVLAAILIAVLAPKPQPRRLATVAPPPVRLETGPLQPPPVVRQFSRRPAAKLSASHSSRVLPKKRLFPTPSPLTTEERLLVELAESHPRELLIRPVGKIEIEPIQIAPLQIDGGQ